MRWITPLFILLLALVPRLASPQILTYDEGRYWVNRSENFLDALKTGQIEETAQSFHPGVMTMWFGAAGITIDRIINGEDHATVDPMQYRSNIRVVMAVVNALGVLAGWFLLRHLLGPRPALLAALLWATDPYIIAHSRILHVDGLTTTTMFLSFLTGWIAFKLDSGRYNPNWSVRWRWLAASAALGGIATLTKFTALSVVGLLGVVVLVANWKFFRASRLPRMAMPFIAWGLIAVIVWFALYPATWAHFDRVIDRLTLGVEVAFEGHLNFFLGEPTIQPGPIYYLLALALRVTPWVMMGLVAAPFALRLYRQQSHLLFGLFLYAVLFLAIMTLQRKQLDRYMLPVFPVLYVFAAVGLLWIVDRLHIPGRTMWSVATLVMVVNTWISYPYEIAYYNPLLGGAATAERTLLVGWGEGLDQAVDYIESDSDDVCATNIMSAYHELVDIYLPCSSITPLDEDRMADADYIVFYINQLQRGFNQPLIDALAESDPAYVARINGVDFAYVYTRQ